MDGGHFSFSVSFTCGVESMIEFIDSEAVCSSSKFREARYLARGEDEKETNMEICKEKTVDLT